MHGRSHRRLRRLARPAASRLVRDARARRSTSSSPRRPTGHRGADRAPSPRSELDPAVRTAIACGGARGDAAARPMRRQHPGGTSPTADAPATTDSPGERRPRSRRGRRRDVRLARMCHARRGTWTAAQRLSGRRRSGREVAGIPSTAAGPSSPSATGWRVDNFAAGCAPRTSVRERGRASVACSRRHRAPSGRLRRDDQSFADAVRSTAGFVVGARVRPACGRRLSRHQQPGVQLGLGGFARARPSAHERRTPTREHGLVRSIAPCVIDSVARAGSSPPRHLSRLISLGPGRFDSSSVDQRRILGVSRLARPQARVPLGMLSPVSRRSEHVPEAIAPLRLRSLGRRAGRGR